MSHIVRDGRDRRGRPSSVRSRRFAVRRTVRERFGSIPGVAVFIGDDRPEVSSGFLERTESLGGRAESNEVMGDLATGCVGSSFGVGKSRRFPLPRAWRAVSSPSPFRGRESIQHLQRGGALGVDDQRGAALDEDVAGVAQCRGGIGDCRSCDSPPESSAVMLYEAGSQERRFLGCPVEGREQHGLASAALIEDRDLLVENAPRLPPRNVPTSASPGASMRYRGSRCVANQAGGFSTAATACQLADRASAGRRVGREGQSLTRPPSATIV